MKETLTEIKKRLGIIHLQVKNKNTVQSVCGTHGIFWTLEDSNYVTCGNCRRTKIYKTQKPPKRFT